MASALDRQLDNEWNSIFNMTYRVVSDKVARKEAFDEELADTLRVGAEYQVNDSRNKCPILVIRSNCGRYFVDSNGILQIRYQLFLFQNWLSNPNNLKRNLASKVLLDSIHLLLSLIHI